MTSVVNCYAPSYSHQNLWDDFKLDGVVDIENLIFGGDLNLCTSGRDIWVFRGICDLLTIYFNKMFSNVGLVGMVPSPLISLEKWAIEGRGVFPRD